MPSWCCRPHRERGSQCHRAPDRHTCCHCKNLIHFLASFFITCQLDTVLPAISIIVGLSRLPMHVAGLSVGSLPHKGSLVGSIGQANPVTLATGQEAGQAGLDKDSFWGNVSVANSNLIVLLHLLVLIVDLNEVTPLPGTILRRRRQSSDRLLFLRVHAKFRQWDQAIFRQTFLGSQFSDITAYTKWGQTNF